MIVYRIDRAKYASTVLTGQGAARHGARWNHKNIPAIYTSESRALCMLEILVHIRTIDLFPTDKVIVTIEIPDDFCPTITADQLPSFWNTLPTPHPYTKQIFDHYCVQGQSGGLRVPSVITPLEYNFVLYPLHKTFINQVKVIDVHPLNWDQRLK